MHITPVMRFFVSPVFCVTWFRQFIFFLMCLELYVSIWNDENVKPNANYSCFRWLDQFEAAPVVLEPEGMAIHLHLLHPRALQKFLPPKLKFCGSWYNLSSNRGVGIMLIKRKKRATSPRCSLKRTSHLTRTLGFTQSSPSFLYWLLLVPKRTRLAMPRSSFADHYHGMLPADHVVNWNEFKLAFRDHHIPAGLLDRKLHEFLALT